MGAAATEIAARGTCERPRRPGSMRLQLLPMPRRFSAVAAGGHGAPAPASVLRVVEEHALASLIRTAADARQLTQDQRVRRRLDNGDHEAGERIADRYERSNEGSVGAEIDATRAGTAP